MIHVWKSDLYRLGKSKLLYGVMAFSCSIALFLVLLMQQDIRVGISVFGDLTAFKGWDDIIRMGITYSKGLGIMAAMLISVFIGQEYQSRPGSISGSQPGAGCFFMCQRRRFRHWYLLSSFWYIRVFHLLEPVRQSSC